MLYYQSWSDICGKIASGVSSVLNSKLSDASLVARKDKRSDPGIDYVRFMTVKLLNSYSN